MLLLALMSYNKKCPEFESYRFMFESQPEPFCKS